MKSRRIARPSASRLLTVSLGVLLLAVFSTPTQAQNENETTGFSSTHIFDGGYFGENIDTLNGNLNLTIPIGPSYHVNRNLSYQLKLVYNSRVWDFADNSGFASRTSLLGESPFGLGFSLSFGRIYRDYFQPVDGVAEQRWYFITPDGNKHDLGDKDAPIPSNDSTYFEPFSYVEDGQITRIVLTNGTGIRYTLGHRVEIPEGPCQLCEWHDANEAFGGWYVTLIEDMTSGEVDPSTGRYPHWVEVQYETPTADGYGQCIETVLDSLGRTIDFHNISLEPGNPRSRRTHQVDLPKFANSPSVTSDKASYLFGHDWSMVKVPIYYWEDPDCVPWGQLCYDPKRTVLRLQSVELPGGYVMRFGYDSITGTGSELTLRTLPMNQGGVETDARMEYAYSDYYYRRSVLVNGGGLSGGKPLMGGALSISGVTRQVVQKRLYLGCDATSASATWDYARVGSEGYSNPERVTVRVSKSDPLKFNETIHYFHASPAELYGSTCGLPDDGCAPEWDDGLGYWTEYWEGAANGGRLLRTEWTTYTSDTFYGHLTKNNIRTVRATTTYVDDGGKQQTTENSLWDPDTHHWKVTTESGSGLSVPRRTHTEYAPHGYRRDTYDYKEISDGTTVISRSDYVYYPSSDRLMTARNRKTPPATLNEDVSVTMSDGDVVTDYTYDSSGNVETKTLSTLVDGVTYTSTIGYQYNGPYLQTKQFSGMDWKSIDWKRDANTGLIYRSCDTAGICTDYKYDDLGRITQILPPWPEYATAISYPTLKETNVWQWSESASYPTTGCPSTEDCIYTKYLYDDLARLVETQRRDAAGDTVHQVTSYDALSNVLSRSEWAKVGDPLALTTYDYTDPSTGEQDPFGRAWKVTTPDGKVTRTSYFGQSSTVTVEGVQGPDGNPLNAKTSYVKDALGRLIEVSSPTAQDAVTGNMLPVDAVRAVYAYDLMDNLTQVDLVSPQATHQYRTFVYDSLSRLLREENPENGTTLYQGYDPLGNLLQRQDNAGNVFKMTYDAAGRLIDALRQSGSTDNLLVHNAYDEPSTVTDSFGFSAGKLTTVQSFDDSGVLQLTQKTYYQGLNGRPSAEVTVFAGISKQYQTWTSYNSYGLPATMRYPYDGTERPLRTLLYGYNNGFLSTVADDSQVPPFPVVKKITYNPAGGIATILLGGDVQDTVTPDLRNRPGRIQVQKIDPVTFAPVADYWDTGGYVYDGAGNIAQIGSVGNSHLTFGYDAANRLVRADIEKGTNPGAASYYQADYNLRFAYDPFGNMISRADLFAGTSRTFTVAPTNRIDDLPFHYDANGNVTEDDQNTYQMDARNRVLSIFATGGDPQLAGTYQYDAAGRRVVKESGSTGMTTFYVRDAQGQVLSEFSRPAGSDISPLWRGDYITVAGRTVAMTERDKPDAPTGLYVESIDNCDDPSQGLQVNLRWRRSAETDVSAYRLYRDSKLISPPDIPVDEPFYTDDTATSGSRYGYQLKALDPLATSGWSATYEVQVCDTTPPDSPELGWPVVGDSRVSLNWTGSTTSGLNAVIGYHVYQGVAMDGVCPGASDPGYAVLNEIPL